MRLLRWLFTWSGTVGRREYFAAGVVFTWVKFLIDRTVALRYGVDWQLWNYFLPTQHSFFNTKNPEMYGVLWAIALPFFWIGIGLTLRRLRSAGRPPVYAALFFVPLLNLVFFLALSLLPEQPGRDNAERERETHRAIASAAIGLLATVLLSVLLVDLSVKGFGLYGEGLFLAVPFFMGFVSSALYNRDRLHTRGQSIGMGIAPIGLLGLLLLVAGYEGLICLAMAIPLAAPLAAAGGLMAYNVCTRRQRPSVTFMGAWILVVPLAMTLEYAAHVQPPVLHVTTAIEINAPPEVVWHNVISFPPLAPPQELLFRSGIAYPTSGEIFGRGVGAVRHCRFSTGEFIEPITVWDEGHLLAFDVTAQPQSMRELSPWPITPPHLERNYMLSRHGQFRFVALPNGRTRLEGTTWYQNYFWPQPYWQAWSDFIVHRIHRRVLEHVKEQAEEKRQSVIGNQ